MSKHTPGPWRVVDGHYPCMSEIEGPSFKISIVMSAADLSFDESMRRAADARLIAAAPELLEALTSIMYRIERDLDHDHEWAIVERELARAALAKAEGTAPKSGASHAD